MATDSSIICQFCKERYNDPRVLTCSHSFCLQCIQHTMYTEANNSVTCAICSSSTSLTPEGTQSLPSNTKLKHQVSRSKAESIVKETFNQLRQALDERKKVLLSEINQIMAAEETRFAIQIESLTNKLKKCKILDKCSDDELVSLSHEMCGQKIDLCARESTADMLIDMSTKDTLSNMILGFGTVTDSKFPCDAKVSIPRHTLGVDANMKVHVTVPVNSKGDNPVVRSTLSCAGGKEYVNALAKDEGNGTYCVSVVPHHLGQYQLSITVNGRLVSGSPFTLNVIKTTNYTKCISQEKDSQKKITDITQTNGIAFSTNGDMFVSSSQKHCIHVYDEDINKKDTFGSQGCGQLQFQSPQGIDVHEGVVYIAEKEGKRIHMMTTEGVFVDTKGEGWFKAPTDIKICPNGDVYVIDNNSVQVFHSDWTIAHIIARNGSSPLALAFDLESNVHVINDTSQNKVFVYSPAGEEQGSYATDVVTSAVHYDSFGKKQVSYTTAVCCALAVDQYGGILIASGLCLYWFSQYFENRIQISNNQRFHLTKVAVSPNGSVWLADTSGKIFSLDES